MKDKDTFIGFMATLTSAIAILPILYNVVINKTTNSIHYVYIFLTITAQILWLIYGIYNHSLPIIILEIYMFLCFMIILIYKLYLESSGKDIYSKLQQKIIR